MPRHPCHSAPTSASLSRSCELALEHLAGRVAGQLVEEDDLARHLVAGQVVLHPGLEVVLGRRCVAERPRRRAAACRTRRRRRRSRPPRPRPRGGTRQSSTSLGKTFSPPETIISSSRPSTYSRPSSSKRPTSPVDISPSTHLLVAAAGVALEEQPVADEDPAGLALRRPPCRPRRGSSRPSRTAACRPCRAPRAGRAGWRSRRRRPRSSRRCCRGCRRTGPSTSVPGRRAAPSRTPRPP